MSKLTRFLNFFRVNKSIAIDLGTSNVLIYDKQKNKIVLNEPSVIVKDRKTGELIAVGKKAKEMQGKTAASSIVIRPLKEGVISDIDATREMLSAFVKQIYGGSPFKPELMVCVPLEMTSIEKRAIFDAAIGAKKVYITASHGVFSGKAIENISNSKVEKCVVTDTIPQEKNLGGKIEVVSVAQYFAKAIDRINNNRPVSMLFDGR